MLRSCVVLKVLVMGVKRFGSRHDGRDVMRIELLASLAKRAEFMGLFVIGKMEERRNGELETESV
jgi:hypothetical protein